MIIDEYIIYEKPVKIKIFDNDVEFYKELKQVCNTEQLADRVYRTLSNMADNCVQVGNIGFVRRK